MIRQISDRVFYSSKNKAIYEFNVDDHPDIGKVKKVKSLKTDKGGEVEIKFWGADNELPQRREELVRQNNIMGELIEKKALILLGRGLQQFREDFQDGKEVRVYQPTDPAIKSFLSEIEFTESMGVCAAIDWYMHGGFFIEWRRKANGGILLRCIRAKYLRAGKKDKNGKIPKWAYCSDWQSEGAKKSENQGIRPVVEWVPNFDRQDFESGAQDKAIMYIGNPTFNDGYYSHPPFWGAKGWIQAANGIPTYLYSELENGYNIKYQIIFPEGYFQDSKALKNAYANNDEDRIKEIEEASVTAKKEFLKAFEESMAGRKNAGKSVHTERMFSPLVKGFEEIEIKVLESPTRGEDLLKIFDKTHEAIIAASGINPMLANVMQPGKLGSGSELKNAYNYYVATSTYIPRRMLLKPINIALDIMDIRPDGAEFTFKDFKMVNLDEDKSGMINTVSDAGE